MATNLPTTKKVFGVLILFSLPFVAVGIWTGVSLFNKIVEQRQIQSWEETPATIVRAKLEINSDSESTTYKATAEYTYQFQGRQYTGKRVSLHGGGDNVGSFQEDTYRQLNEHQRSGRPFRCYVNPDRPAEAILFRDLRWEMVIFNATFAAGFGLAGFGMFAIGVFGYFHARNASNLATLHPDEPWLWKKQWADGKIRSCTGTIALGLLGLALFWNVMTTPVYFGLHDMLVGKAPAIMLIFLLFPIVGAGLLLWAMVYALRWRKYGQSVFEMAAVPGVIGGQLAGVIRTSTKVQPEEGFRLALNCVQKTTHGDSSSETVLWQDEQLIARELSQSDPELSAILVLFQIPYDCRPTDETGTSSQTIWRLEVSAKTPGLDYSTSFEVPVFKTPQSDPNFVVDRSLIAEYAAPEDPDRDLRDAGVIGMPSPTGDGCRFVFPMARTPCIASAVTVTGLVFAAVPIAPFFLDAGFLGIDGWLNVIFGVLFGLLGLFVLAGSADLWFYRSVVDVSADGLTVTGGWFGLGRERHIEAADIEKIVPISRMSSGSGEGKKVYYDIDILRTTGKKVTAGKRLPSKRLAEAVIRQIEQAMGKQ